MIGNKIKKRKGFTLIELIVSIFMFLIIMTAIVSIFASQIRAYKHARVSQNDLENAQFAMNYISKTLRTATLLGENLTDLRNPDQFGDDDFAAVRIESGQKLTMYDFSQELCLQFYFDTDTNYNSGRDTALWVISAPDVKFDAIEECLEQSTYQGSGVKTQRLTSGDVEGTFWMAPTRYQDHLGSTQTDTIGRATVGMSILPPHSDPLHDTLEPIYIQTSVSLRDYPPDLSF